MVCLDPPYWGGESDYGKGLFSRDQFQEMAAILADIEGNWLLSINDVPEIREIFAGWHMQELKLKYTISSVGATEAAELLISNSAPTSDLLCGLEHQTPG